MLTRLSVGHKTHEIDANLRLQRHQAPPYPSAVWYIFSYIHLPKKRKEPSILELPRHILCQHLLYTEREGSSSQEFLDSITILLSKATSGFIFYTIPKHNSPGAPRCFLVSTGICHPHQIRYLSFARQQKLTKEQRIQESKYLPHLFDNDSNGSPIGFRELQLRLFSASIREKPRWWEKMRMGHVRAHWTKELEKQDVDGDFIQFFFKELEKYRGVERVSKRS